MASMQAVVSAMRDPLSWSVPIYRAFGIGVRIHIFFFVFAIGLFLRQAYLINPPVTLFDIFLVTVFLLFVVILLHEYGHCYGARSVGGEPREILMWPLGGLALGELPHSSRALFISTAAGPMVNVILCLICTMVMAVSGFLPSLNPISSPYDAVMYNYNDGHTYSSEYGYRFYNANDDTEFKPKSIFDDEGERTIIIPDDPNIVRAVAPTGMVWVQRIFWISWVLLLFNLLPAYPLDGGQLLQAIVWSRRDFARGVTIACYSGYGVGVIGLIVSIATGQPLVMGLAIYMLLTSWMKLRTIDVEDNIYGDFSAGYTSLNRDDDEPQPKRAGPLKRWMQARRAQRIQRLMRERQREDDRMDSLLDKIFQHGRDSLTDEERRFMERISARNKDQ